MKGGGMASAQLVVQVAWIVLWIVVSVGCKPNEPRYHYFEQLPDETWSQDREIFFSTSDLDSTQLYDVDLVLRLKRDIRYQQLPIGIAFETPSRHFTTRVVNVPLSHLRLRSGGFAIYEQSLRIEEGVQYPEQGVYTYSVRQLSTDSIVKGVVEVGLTMTPRE